MANNYIKPFITFEKLSMSNPTSASCALNVSFAEFSCPILIEEWGETVFATTSSPRCDWTNDDFYICYHVPTAGSNVFGS
ncbi:MAG: hypothetical protein IJR51_10820 [Clostridia bacterium]|nr:hypothetical protein [Clostridia bacterium]MBQ9507638.1 hypothetical protein [Clostridia bacterium]MBR5424650.1 hypothetical protein [Clostridia bacterium]